MLLDMFKYPFIYLHYWQRFFDYVNITAPSGLRRLIAPGNLVLTLTVDNTTGRYAVITSQSASLPLPAALLDSHVPAASTNTAADRISTSLDIHNIATIV